MRLFQLTPNVELAAAVTGDSGGFEKYEDCLSDRKWLTTSECLKERETKMTKLRAIEMKMSGGDWKIMIKRFKEMK